MLHIDHMLPVASVASGVHPLRECEGLCCELNLRSSFFSLGFTMKHSIAAVLVLFFSAYSSGKSPPSTEVFYSLFCLVNTLVVGYLVPMYTLRLHTSLVS